MISRKCTKCLEVKIISCFHKDKKASKGYSRKCALCASKQQKIWYKKWRLVVPARPKPIYKITSKEYQRNKNYIHTYGITLEKYNELLTKQKEKCAICSKPQVTCSKFLSVDHDHTTGKVRGLLCDNCNLMIGNAKDDVYILRRAIKYLKIKT